MTDEVTYDTAAVAEVTMGEGREASAPAPAAPVDGMGCHAGADKMEEAARAAGGRGTRASGPGTRGAPGGSDRLSVETAEEMQAAVDAVIEGADVFIAAAAVSDYRPATFETQKIKKTEDSLSLALDRNPDILAGVASRSPRPFTVGFAAETTDVIANARDKLARKGLDMIIANQVGDGLAFDRDDNAMTVLWDGGEQAFARDAKTRLAQSLVALIGERVAAV